MFIPTVSLDGRLSLCISRQGYLTGAILVRKLGDFLLSLIGSQVCRHNCKVYEELVRELQHDPHNHWPPHEQVDRAPLSAPVACCASVALRACTGRKGRE
jgi:hypothetical protein